ncbi:hypothetical protein C8R44DRAFT_981811 [Mycena epipterygia]|nr:hypothetical protein C8R44DRAFT_981811 [Mycena epipterygia]
MELRWATSSTKSSSFDSQSGGFSLLLFFGLKVTPRRLALPVFGLGELYLYVDLRAPILIIEFNIIIGLASPVGDRPNPVPTFNFRAYTTPSSFLLPVYFPLPTVLTLAPPTMRRCNNPPIPPSMPRSPKSDPANQDWLRKLARPVLPATTPVRFGRQERTPASIATRNTWAAREGVSGASD